jgi:hypothetical protein
MAAPQASLSGEVRVAWEKELTVIDVPAGGTPLPNSLREKAWVNSLNY